MKLTLAKLVLLGLVVAPMAAPLAAYGELPQGSTPAAFIGSAGDWMNTKPLTWADLRGKVVMVDFWEYTCVNCIRTYPYLKAWNERYSKYGLVIIGIHRPEFDFAKSKAFVAAAARRAGLAYPILNDPDYRNWQAYHEHSWPSKYIFDQSGHLVDQHMGEGEYQETELLVQRLLRKTHPGAEFPKPLPPQKPGDDPSTNCSEPTLELYTNPDPAYHDLGNLPSGWKMGKAERFVDRPHEEGRLYYQGTFIPMRQRLRHGGATSDLHDYIALRYRATEVNVVAGRTEARDYKVYVWLDGKAIPKAFQGDDIGHDSKGSYFTVTAPRMYNLIRGPYGPHEIVLASDSPDFEIYSYTFSGCPQRWPQ
jgi:thiol-disulfide isomerase/thioredoxin